jgi:AcrR family transcriptional regulator
VPDTRVLTAKGSATRSRIVAGAATLIRDRGVTEVGLDDIRTATATSKSQLFHYFPDGKTELLHAVAIHEADAVIADQQPQLDELTSWKAWWAWRDVVVDKYARQGDRCPLAALTGQLGPADPATRTIIADLLNTWRELLAAGVRAVRPETAKRGGAEADRIADSILAAVQGGVVMLQATGELRHLEHALDTALEPLRDANERRA